MDDQSVKELLIHLLENKTVKVEIEGLDPDLNDLVNQESIRVLKEIQLAMDRDTSDFECIDEIIGILDEHGLDSGYRHDFG